MRPFFSRLHREFKKLFFKRSHYAKDVERFYDTNNAQFLQVYRTVIQAFRTTDPTKILDYEMGQMGLKDTMRVLDAGCGVCGPAVHFAQQKNVLIDAITVSNVQFTEANKLIPSGKEMVGKVRVKHGDYHKMSSVYGKEVFDIIYFLESFGHSPNQNLLLSECWNALKPGGYVYIKDLFRRVGHDHKMQQDINEEIDKINTAYYYNVIDLNRFIEQARKAGFVLVFVKTIDIMLEDFENLTISNDFQELTGIGRIENWDDYTFPVDFFEVKLYKPVFSLEEGVQQYFLQNLLARSKT